MEEDFTKKIKYECKYCKKIFSTTRHDCKWTPNKKGCLTCKHCRGFEKGEGDIYDEYSLSILEHQSSFFICDKASECNEFEVIMNNNWNGYCDLYEAAGCENMRKRYGEIMAVQIAREGADSNYLYNSWRGVEF